MWIKGANHEIAARISKRIPGGHANNNCRGTTCARWIFRRNATHDVRGAAAATRINRREGNVSGLRPRRKHHDLMPARTDYVECDGAAGRDHDVAWDHHIERALSRCARGPPSRKVGGRSRSTELHCGGHRWAGLRKRRHSAGGRDRGESGGGSGTGESSGTRSGSIPVPCCQGRSKTRPLGRRKSRPVHGWLGAGYVRGVTGRRRLLSLSR